MMGVSKDLYALVDQVLSNIGALPTDLQVDATKYLLKVSQVLESYINAKSKGAIVQESPDDLKSFVQKFTNTRNEGEGICSETSCTSKAAPTTPTASMQIKKRSASDTIVLFSSNVDSTDQTSTDIDNMAEQETVGTLSETLVSSKYQKIELSGPSTVINIKTKTEPRGDPQKHPNIIDSVLNQQEEGNLEADDPIDDTYSDTIDETKEPVEDDDLSITTETLEKSSDELTSVKEEQHFSSTSEEHKEPPLKKRKENNAEFRSTLCTECGRSFSTHCSLQVHLRSHTGDRPYHCSFCTRSFTTKANMQRHERVHLGIKDFECPTCHKKFSEKKALEVHERTHKGIKPYKCETCGAAFTQMCTLRTHEHIHTGWKGHLCDICGRSFRQKTQLTQHKLRHRADKPHKCTTCDASFQVKGDLQRHMLTHSGSKPFQCSLCPRAFTRPNYLNDHMNWHSGYRPYQCPKCPASYSERSSFYKHINKEHAAQRTVQKTVLPLTEPRTLVLGENDALIEGGGLVAVSQSEGDTFILYTDGSGKQQLIPVKPNTDCDVAICEEVIEVSRDNPNSVTTSVTGVPRIVELKSTASSASSMKTSHEQTQLPVSSAALTTVLNPVSAESTFIPVDKTIEIEGDAPVQEVTVTEESLTGDYPTEPPTNEQTDNVTVGVAGDGPGKQEVSSADSVQPGTDQHVELIFTNGNPDQFIRQLEQLTSGQVEVIINEQNAAGDFDAS